ncbi:MAG: Polyketide cyclase / dehydrase and lipid transport, partial [Mucilaginibacter sp.]|nr:Polyketide cyclase / dehydrase and lipid transport [Mucilaginibacter sp.]
KVRFRDAEDNKGTLIDIVITYQPPAGGVGASIAHVLNPVFKNMVDNDVRNFKQYMDLDVNGIDKSGIHATSVQF